MKGISKKQWLISIIMILSFICSGFFGLLTFSGDAEVSDPDYYGYSWEDEIPYFWEEINTTGTSIDAGDWTGDIDDGYFQVILGATFSFNFYGAAPNNIYIGTNGILSFSTSGMTGFNSRWNRRIPNSNSPNRYIASFWDDFEYLDGLTEVYYEIKGGGTTEYLVVEYVNLVHKSTREPCTFEVILNETSSEIWYIYKDLPRNQYCRGYGATIGLEDSTGYAGIQYSYNQEVLREEMVLHFVPNEISDLVTASSTSNAPDKLWSGNHSALMLRLNLSVDNNAAQLDSLRFDQIGTAGVSNITSVSLYLDSDRNGIFDSEIDTFLDKEALTDAATDYVIFDDLHIFFNLNKLLCFFVLVDISESIKPGATVQLAVSFANYIDLQGIIDEPVVGPFPLQSTVSTLIDSPCDHVTITRDPFINPPTTISGGNSYVFCKLNFSIDANHTYVTQLLVNQTGTVTNTDVNWIGVWHDENGNGVIDTSEPQIGSGSFDVFGSANVNIWGPGLMVSSLSPSYILLQIDLNPTVDGKTVSFEIEKFDKIRLNGNDSVNDINFPIETGVATVSNTNVVEIMVDPNPASLGSLRAGQRDVPVLQVNLSVTTGSVEIFGIQVDKNHTGTFTSFDIPYQRLYKDVNDNGVVDEGIDELLGESNNPGIMFMFWSMGPFGWRIMPNNPLVLLFTIDIEETAPTGAGNFTGINITFPNYINYNPWTYVLNYPFPIESNMYPLAVPTSDSLVVTYDDVIPSTIFAGETVVVERLDLTTTSNEVGISELTLRLNGTATNFDVQQIEAYYDLNDDGQVSPSIDKNLGMAWFDANNNATINLMGMGLPFVAKFGIIRSILIVYTITEYAISGTTVGLNIKSSLNFSVEGPNDNVSPSGFPIDSSLATITYQDTLNCQQDTRVTTTTIGEGARQVLMMRINLSASTGTITVEGFRVNLMGSILYWQLGNIYAYEDINENAVFDREIDFIIGKSSFNMLGWSYIDFSMQGPFIIYSGITRSILLLVDVDYDTYGRTIGLNIGFPDVSVSTSDNVSIANFPLQTVLASVIGSAHDILTVEMKDLAPENVTQAEERVEMLKLILSADSGNVHVTRFKIGFNGTASYKNISKVYLVHDVNKNNIFDPIDKVLDKHTFYMGRIYFRYDEGFFVNASEPEHIIIAYDISLDAIVGTNVGVYIKDQSNFTIECINDSVAAFNDYNSSLSVIQPAIVDILTITWSDISPASIYENDKHIEILRLDLAAGSGDIYLEAITINLTGTLSNWHINWIDLIHDKNSNGKYDIGLDKIIGGSWFSSMTTVITVSQFHINASKPETILLSVDIAWDAGGKSFGLEIEKQEYDDNFNMFQMKEGLDVMEVGDDYGEMPQGTENEGDGFNDFTQAELFGGN